MGSGALRHDEGGVNDWCGLRVLHNTRKRGIKFGHKCFAELGVVTVVPAPSSQNVGSCGSPDDKLHLP